MTPLKVVSFNIQEGGNHRLLSMQAVVLDRVEQLHSALKRRRATPHLSSTDWWRCSSGNPDPTNRLSSIVTMHVPDASAIEPAPVINKEPVVCEVGRWRDWRLDRRRF